MPTRFCTYGCFMYVELCKESKVQCLSDGKRSFYLCIQCSKEVYKCFAFYGPLRVIQNNLNCLKRKCQRNRAEDIRYGVA